MFSVFALECFGQVPVNQPEMPVMYKVTVNPVEGYDTVIWYSSTEGLVDYYAVCYSKITNPNQPYILSEPIAIIYPPDTVYVNQDTESGMHSIGYSVIAVNVIDENSAVQSIYDYPDSTVFTQAVFDSCDASVTIIWNRYNKWRGHIGSYRIYQRIDGSASQVVAIIDVEDITTYKARYVPENRNLGFYVETIHEDSIRTSVSNMATIYTGMLEVPDYIVGHSANIGTDNHIVLDFDIDPDTELSEYKLLRSTDINGDYDTISSFRQHDQRIILTDNVDYTSGIYYYQLIAINRCNLDVQKSNVINNIILSGTNAGMLNHLAWNPVEDWPGETERYVLYRSDMSGTGQRDSILLNKELTYTDDVTAFFTESNAYTEQFCYQIRAIETNNPFTQNSVAFSNEFCISITGVRLPNAFIPNNPSGENSLFKPIFLFQPVSYEMVIYNRWGNKIWEGNIPWDGTANNHPVPEGVYVYQIKVFYPDDTITLTGHITVLYR
jgi:gliding motility-associated-like protein